MEWVQFQDGMREDPLINEIGFLCVPSCDPQFVVENHKVRVQTWVSVKYRRSATDAMAAPMVTDGHVLWVCHTTL